MTDPTDTLAERVDVLEALVHRLLLLVGAAGEMLGSVRRPMNGEEES
jgi:hypothetical protein